MTHTKSNNQSIADIAVLYFGTIDGVFDLIKSNQIHLDKPLKIGDKLTIPQSEISEADIRAFFEKHAKSIATDTDFATTPSYYYNAYPIGDDNAFDNDEEYQVDLDQIILDNIEIIPIPNKEGDPIWGSVKSLLYVEFLLQNNNPFEIRATVRYFDISGNRWITAVSGSDINIAANSSWKIAITEYSKDTGGDMNIPIVVELADLSKSKNSMLQITQYELPNTVNTIITNVWYYKVILEYANGNTVNFNRDGLMNIDVPLGSRQDIFLLIDENIEAYYANWRIKKNGILIYDNNLKNLVNSARNSLTGKVSLTSYINLIIDETSLVEVSFYNKNIPSGNTLIARINYNPIS